MSYELDRSAKLYYEDISKVPILTAEEERKLITLWKKKKDIKARDQVLKSCLRFVVSIARKHTKDPNRLPDLIAAGNVGLMNALDRFDVKKKFRFLTYAAWWIAESIHRETYAANPVHIPTHRQKAQRKAAKEYAQALAKQGPESESLKALNPGLPDATAVALELLGDVAGDSKNNITNKQADKLLRKAIENLSTREQTVLYLYFGLKDTSRNLGQIARLLDMSPERIRQIKIAAVKALRDILAKQHNVKSVQDIYD